MTKQFRNCSCGLEPLYFYKEKIPHYYIIPRCKERPFYRLSSYLLILQTYLPPSMGLNVIDEIVRGHLVRGWSRTVDRPVRGDRHLPDDFAGVLGLTAWRRMVIHGVAVGLVLDFDPRFVADRLLTW